MYQLLGIHDAKLLKQIRLQHNEFLCLADIVLLIAYRVFPRGNRQHVISPGAERCLLAQYTQVFRLFRSSLLLCKFGHGLEGQIILRSMLEVTAILLYLAERDHDSRVAQYRHSYQMSRYAALRRLCEEFPEFRKRFGQTLKRRAEQYQEALAYFRRGNSHVTEDDIKKKYVLKPEVVAFQIDIPELKKMWRIAYPISSGVAHGQDLVQFIDVADVSDGKGLEISLRTAPTNTAVNACLINSMKLLYWSMERMNDLLGLGMQEEIQQLDEEHDNMFSKNIQPESLDK